MLISTCTIPIHIHMRGVHAHVHVHVHAHAHVHPQPYAYSPMRTSACRIRARARRDAPPRMSKTRAHTAHGESRVPSHVSGWMCVGAVTWACLGTRRHAARQTRGRRACARHVAMTARPISYVAPPPMGKRCHGSKVRQYPLRVWLRWTRRSRLQGRRKGRSSFHDMNSRPPRAIRLTAAGVLLSSYK